MNSSVPTALNSVSFLFEMTIQRFLLIKALSILVIWFPIIREVISRQIKARNLLMALLNYGMISCPVDQP